MTGVWARSCTLGVQFLTGAKIFLFSPHHTPNSGYGVRPSCCTVGPAEPVSRDSGVPRNFVRGGVQKIQFRIEDRENGDLGAVAP